MQSDDLQDGDTSTCIRGMTVGSFFRCEDMATSSFSVLVVAALLVVARPLSASPLGPGSGQSCGYGSCNPVKDDMINVHVVPHTHDDVGWLMTVDQYYYSQVQYILDSVVQELQKDPTKRFMYVEIAYFARWFREQDDATRHVVKGLVNEGQLEFILGGWCMNDEAATHYNAIIDQHALGFEFLRQNFGDCGRPRVGWQIDPFGHSREQASIFAQFGFDSLFFGRLDYQDKDLRQNTQTMEMIWRGSPANLGAKADLFTGVLQDGYGPPGGFCFDIYCGDSDIKDDSRLHDYNVDDEVKRFLDAINDQAKHYTTNHLMVTMGSDFQYQAAHNWYKNLDKLIAYVNQKQAEGSNVNLLYSTPSCYTYYVNRANKTWTTKEDDFFPYAHRPHSFWTGYFTSRAALKNYVRRTNNFFQVVKQMDALAQLTDSDNSTLNIQILAEAMGVVQHHDGVSGTEKQAVAYDYAERLANGVNEGQKVIADAYKKLLPVGTIPAPDRFFCPLLNISVCSVTETGSQFQVTVYNPLARYVEYNIRVPISGTSYTVVGPSGITVPSEIFPISPDTERIPERSGVHATYELVFPVSLPPLGFYVYFVSRTSEPESTTPQAVTQRSTDSDFVISGEYISLVFDGTSGLLKTITNLEKNVSIAASQDFWYYVGFNGNNSQAEVQASGAYIFRPLASSARSVRSARISTSKYYVKGSVVQEVYQQFSPWITQVVRVYSNQRFAEFQWTVGPIPIDDNLGKEVISRFTSDLNSEGVFYTDANGREILQRRLNHRDTWQLNQTEPVAGNYYPVNSRIYIRDEARQLQLTVLTDRSEGGSSLLNGSVELMVHRRLLHDDSLGVGEPLNETGADGKGLVVRGSHYVLLEPISATAAAHRDLAERLYMAPHISFTEVSASQSEWQELFLTMWTGVRSLLPPNVHLLTLQQFPSNGPVPSATRPYLLRLEHIYEVGEDAILSQPAVVSLQRLFEPFDITEATELTLGANLPLADLSRLQWQIRGQAGHGGVGSKQGKSLKFKSEKVNEEDADPLTIVLNPMEIRTFQITIGPPTQ